MSNQTASNQTTSVPTGTAAAREGERPATDARERPRTGTTPDGSGPPTPDDGDDELIPVIEL
jgi:hypothetical protein